MKRNKPYYSKKQIRNLISAGKVHIDEELRTSISKTFGWTIDDTCDAIMALPLNCCYGSESRYDDPEVWVDYYRAPNLKGENIYTHFYVEDGILVIDSFKEL